MGTVRPLEERDLPGLVALHERVNVERRIVSRASLHEHLLRIFFRHPWRNDRLPSLGYEEQGRLMGCLGVVPRPMSYGERRLTATVSHSFIVDPDSRGSLAALELSRSYIAGAQDLSMAEANDAARHIWEWAGGSTSMLHSLQWTRPLRPAQYLLSLMRRAGLGAVVGGLLKPVSRAADALMPLFAPRAFDLEAPRAEGVDLDADALTAAIAEFTRRWTLRPIYDAQSAGWLLEGLRRNAHGGSLQRVLVRAPGGRTLGWYLYLHDTLGAAELVQLGAAPDTVGEVLDHLFHHALQRGALAISGQCQPHLLTSLTRRRAVFHHGGDSWLLVHSRHPELLRAIHDGDAYLTRLEGEWWIGTAFGAG